MAPDGRRRFGMQVKRLRKKAGLSQAALAFKAKLSPGYLARLEVGRHDPTLTTLKKLAKALGVPVTELLE
jgi:transcriptional regulator with XRE-family HTH domain